MPAARKSPLISCEDCGKQFKSHYILILHARYHRKESNYIFQRHNASGYQPEADGAAGEAQHRDDPDEPPPASNSPPAVLGQLSPPHLPNPMAPDMEAGHPDDDENNVHLEEEAGSQDRDDDEEEYSVNETGQARRSRVADYNEDDDDEDDYEMESAEELECEICDARFHQVLELLKHIRVHRYELTESNYQQYRRKIVTTYRPNNVRLDLRRLADEAGRDGQEAMFEGGGGGGGGGRHAAPQGAAGGGYRPVEAANASTEYECDYCGKRFPTASNLRRHIPVHTGERPHQCPFCGCRFGDRSYMLKHTRFVHNVELARVQKAKTRPRYASSACFKCQICNRYFENGDILAVHLEKYHSRPGESARHQQQQKQQQLLRQRQHRSPRSRQADAGEVVAVEDEDADEYPEEEDALLGGHQAAGPDTETLFSCDQCDFISADLAQLHAHLAEHGEQQHDSAASAQQQQLSMSPPAEAVAGADGAKSRLTVTISDGRPDL